MSDHTVVEDEISLSDIIAKLWVKRGLIVALPLIAVLAAIGYVIAQSLAYPRPVTYMINLKNIDNRQYPNGASFSPHDLLIPEVLAPLRQQFKLPADAPLRRAISVSYDSLLAEGIARSYRDRLAQRNLTQAEVLALNQEYLSDLRDAMRSSLRITVDYGALGVDSDVGASIARALPEIWTSVYTTQFRIFTNPTLADATVTRDREDLQTTSSVLAAHARIATMQRGLEVLRDDNRLSMLQLASGISAADLREELKRLEILFFHPIRAGGLKSDDPVAVSYLAQLRLDIADKRRKIAGYDDALNALKAFQRSNISQIPQGSIDQQTAFPERQTLQMGDTAISELIQMAERASYTNFVQETLRNRNELVFEISNLTKEIELATVQGAAASSSAFREQAADGLDKFTKQYLELVATARTKLRDGGGALFEPALGPLAASPLLSRTNLLTVIAAGLFSGIIAVLIALLSGPRIRQRAQAI